MVEPAAAVDRPHLIVSPLSESEESRGAPRPGNAVNALIHLYRAEVGRMTTYRQRLDTTTNWGITSSALVTTFALGNTGISHAAFLFLMFVNFFFLVVEARRFRVYEAARFRVLILERYFYPEVLGEPVPPRWLDSLLDSLKTPFTYPSVGLLGAMGWRLRRNYLWIYLIVLITWLTKLNLADGPLSPTQPVQDLLQRASIGSLPGGAVWFAIVVVYAALCAIALLAHRTYPMGNEAVRTILSSEPD
jgi:uncharacterized membrane protein